MEKVYEAPLADFVSIVPGKPIAGVSAKDMWEEAKLSRNIIDQPISGVDPV